MSRSRQLRGLWVGAAALVAALTPAVAPAHADAPSPVLEFVTPGGAFPVHFTASGGAVTAALTGFNTVVHCEGSGGEGEITGPRSTVSHYAFTGCETQTGTEAGRPCESEGASANEIRSGEIEAELVFISRQTREVGMLLIPHGGVYLSFECGVEPVKAIGPFLSPVGPIDQPASSFTADLHRSGTTQVPEQYENAFGDPLMAVPTGERNGNPPVPTAVELGFAIHTAVPIEVRAETTAEIEAAQRAERAAAEAAVRQRGEEAARAAAERKHQEEEAAAAAQRQQEEAAAKARAARLSKALKRCRKVKPGHRRSRCQARAKKKYGALAAGKSPR
jgi:hypothetical protein